MGAPSNVSPVSDAEVSPHACILSAEVEHEVEPPVAVDILDVPLAMRLCRGAEG